jgi:hypothetical protein
MARWRESWPRQPISNGGRLDSHGHCWVPRSDRPQRQTVLLRARHWSDLGYLEIPERCCSPVVFMQRLASPKVVLNTKCLSKEQVDCRSAARYFPLSLDSQ